MSDQDMIRRGDTLDALRKHAKGKTVLGGQTYQSLTLEVAQEAINAIPAVQPAVKIKPLVWEYHPTGAIAAPSSAQTYIIDTRMKGRVYFVKGIYPSPQFDTSDQAKAAAKADYERRILAAIEPIPAVHPEPEAELWRGATNSVTAEDAYARGLADGLAAAVEAAHVSTTLRYCSDCGSISVPLDNRCGCGSGRIMHPSAKQILTTTLPSGLAPLLAARDARVWEQALRDAASVAHEWQNETGTDIAAAARICPQVSDAILALIAKGGAE